MILRCDSRGDRRFSAWYASLHGQSIEERYQGAKRDAEGRGYATPKGMRPSFFFLGGALFKAEHVQYEYYLLLWHAYLKQHHALLLYANTFTGFQDIFDGHRGRVYRPSKLYPQADRCCQAEAIAHLIYLYRSHEKHAYPRVLVPLWKELL